MKNATFVAAIAATLWVAGPSRAQDNGVEKLFQKTCKNCHGPKAQGLASYPKLSDKDAAFIQMRLEQYRAGEKVGPNSPLMIPHARDLTDDEILNLATYVTTAFD
ncbi:MAG: c-type cytochrome [Pseudomonadota bacterium]